MRMRTRFALALGLVLSAALIASPAFAGFTLVEKDYVGDTENLNKVGGGDQSAASEDAVTIASCVSARAATVPSRSRR